MRVQVPPRPPSFYFALHMTDLNTDDSHDHLAAKRTTRPKRRLPKRVPRLLLALATIVVVVVIIVVAVTLVRNSGESAKYQTYMTTISGLLKQSDTIGTQVVGLMTDPRDTTRKEIQTGLDKAIATSQQLETKATALEAPKELVEQNVHQFLLLVLHFRLQGLTDLKPALMNALESQNVEVTSERVSKALTYLSNSDFLYQEVFVRKTTDILKEKNIAGVSVPDTQFLSDPDLASKSRVQEALAVLKSTETESPQAVRGVAVTKVMASPDGKEIVAGETQNLTSSDVLAFLVSIENQGNMVEKDVPVTVTLQAADAKEPQKASVTIPELKAKAKVTVTVKGLEPTTYGEISVLRVEVGPVKDEKFIDNNSIETNVIFTL
jgi:hypothetical protein